MTGSSDHMALSPPPTCAKRPSSDEVGTPPLALPVTESRRLWHYSALRWPSPLVCLGINHGNHVLVIVVLKRISTFVVRFFRNRSFESSLHRLYADGPLLCWC